MRFFAEFNDEFNNVFWIIPSVPTHWRP
jgi:hypothetical protein